MHTKKIAGLCLVAVLGVLSLAGCPQKGGTGSLRLMITDKPYPYDFIQEASVTITRVEVHAASGSSDNSAGTGDGTAVSGATDEAGSDGSASSGSPTSQPSGDGGSQDSSAEDDESDGSFVVVFTGQKSFNLLDLRNGRADLLADADIPAGHYDQMRLVVTAGHVTLKDGREFPLKVPSGAQSGIKLHFEFDVQDGEQAQLLLDVDLSRAFSAIPSGHIDDVSTIRSFEFHPSLAMRLINVVQAATVSGHVTDASGNPLANVAVTAFNGTTEVSNTSTEADGSYQLGGLPTGTYRVEFSLSGYQDASVDNVSAQAGSATQNVNATLQAAAAQ